MKLDKKQKVEKVVSKDNHRKQIAMPYLKNDDGVWNLYATDSYKLIQINIIDGDEMTEGYIPLEAIKESRRTGLPIDASQIDKVSVGGTSYTRPTEIGDYINKPSSLIPDRNIAGSAIGINAKYLYELSQAMGTDIVKLEFDISKDGSILPLSPVLVSGNACAGAIMPVRIPE